MSAPVQRRGDDEVARVAHDLVNVLGIILGNAQIALWSERGQPARSELEAIERAASEAVALTRRLTGGAEGARAASERHGGLAPDPPGADEETELEVVIVEDHLALRKGVELLLRGQGIRVIGVSDSPDEGVRMIRARRPDVAIVDIGLDEGPSGLDLVATILADDPDAGILLYTGEGDGNVLRAALESGARGFALKAGPPAELLAAVRAVAAGREYIDPRVAGLLDADEARAVRTISPREREVLDLLATGLKNEEIAERLYLSPETVQTHVRNLMRKLGARTRAHALALALRLREIELD